MSELRILGYQSKSGYSESATQEIIMSTLCLIHSHLKIQSWWNVPGSPFLRIEFFFKRKLNVTKFRSCFVASRFDFAVKINIGRRISLDTLRMIVQQSKQLEDLLEKLPSALSTSTYYNALIPFLHLILSWGLKTSIPIYKNESLLWSWINYVDIRQCHILLTSSGLIMHEVGHSGLTSHLHFPIMLL